MLLDNCELHNVAETKSVVAGLALQRVPESVRCALNPHAQERMLDATCMEIRFVVENGAAEVTLCALAGKAHAQLFRGEFQDGPLIQIGAAPTTIPIPASEGFLGIARAQLGRTAFAPRVCRVCLSGGQVALIKISGNVRPPRRDELPPTRYLAYGTSITQGAGTSVRHLCYAAQTARRLRADLINLGVGNSAQCEPALADYVVARADWDFATVEPTANMQHFALAEYEDRLGYWLRALAASSRQRPVFCLTLLPQAADLGADYRGRQHQAAPEQYREAMRRVVNAAASPWVRLIEGPDLLADFRGLGPDLLHPKDNGHIEIGERLAGRLQLALATMSARRRSHLQPKEVRV